MSGTINKWQKVYIDTYYNGKMPRDKSGRKEMEILGNVKEKVTIHFPKFESPIKSQCHDAYVKTYIVVESGSDMGKGIIDVTTLASNLSLWTSRGYKIEY